MIRRALIVALAALLPACASEGATGPEGPQGVPGPAGLQGPIGNTLRYGASGVINSSGIATASWQVTVSASTGLPVFSCYTSHDGFSWASIADGWSATTPFCLVNWHPSTGALSSAIGLGTPGDYYYMVIAF